MKIKISDNELALNSARGVDARFIIASGTPDDKSLGSVGTDWPSVIRRAKLHCGPVAWDFSIIAAAVVCADQAVGRAKCADGWTRRIDLQIGVLNAPLWRGVAGQLIKALGFLTGDFWALEFVEDLSIFPASTETVPLNNDCVSLLSGGLDSLVGGIDLAADGKQPLFVSQKARGDSTKQIHFAQRISGKEESHFQFGEKVHLPQGMRAETSHRARSILFLAMGALAACATKGNLRGGNRPKTRLVVPENGFISVNPPLTITRLGSHSTKTTHPCFLALIQGIFDQVGINVEIYNPYQWETKGEMIKKCKNPDLLKSLVFESTSCGRYARTYTHCGRCVPCIIRRAAIKHNFSKDKTHNGYLYGDLAVKDKRHAYFTDVLAIKMALKTFQTHGIESWAGSSLSNDLIPDVGACKSMLVNGMNEIDHFMHRYRVRD